MVLMATYFFVLALPLASYATPPPAHTHTHTYKRMQSDEGMADPEQNGLCSRVSPSLQGRHSAIKGAVTRRSVYHSTASYGYNQADDDSSNSAVSVGGGTDTKEYSFKA